MRGRLAAGLHFLALVCLLVCLGSADVVGQVPGTPEALAPDSSMGRPWTPSGSACQTDCWSAASVYVGWMTVPNRIHVGYDGLVPPGACISSVFVYPLRGVQVGASVPARLTEKCALRAYGAYLFPYNSPAGQELTWTNNPPGVREWRHSRSESYKVGGEILVRMSAEMAVVGGFRWESLLTNFSDPNPDYLFTVPSLQAQTTVTAYEPYLGIRLQQNPGPGGLTLQLVGFPAMFSSVQHLNVCNNRGVPFAHTGRQNTDRGYFLEALAEYRVGLLQGVEVSGFMDWNIFYGQCPMTIERHEGGPNPGITSATVSWSHHISSLVIGGKVQISWNLPL
jgi:hypothetical protein